MREWLRRLQPFRIPVIASLSALLLAALMPPLRQHYPFAPFIAAVLVSAWFGGWRASVTATALSALGLVLLMQWQADTAAGTTPEFLIRLALFCVVGALSGYLSQQCRQAIHAFDWMQHSLSHLGDALILTDTQGRISFLNSRAQEITGWSLNLAREQPLHRIVRFLQEGSRQPWPLPSDRVARDRITVSLPADALLECKGAPALPIEGTVGPILQNEGDLAGFIVTFRDITKRKKQEQEWEAVRQQSQDTHALLRALLEATPDAVIIRDADNRCRLANAAGSLLLAERAQAAADPQHEASDREALATGEPQAYEWAAAGDETPRIYRSIKAVCRTEEDRLVGLLEVVCDVTELRQAEAERQQARDEADHLRAEAARAQAQGQAQVGQARADLEKQLRETTERHNQAVQALRQEKETLQRQLAEQQTAAQRLQEQHDRATQELRAQVQAGQTARRTAEAALATAQAELAKLQAERAAAKGPTAEEVQRQREELQKELEELRRTTTARAAALEEQCRQLEKQGKEAQELCDLAALEIDDVKKKHDAALQRLRFAEALIEHAEAGIVGCDREGAAVIVNRLARAWHGLPEEPPPGPSPLPLEAYFRPDGTTRVHPSAHPLRRALEGQAVRQRELVIGPREGTQRAVIVGAAPITDRQNQRLGAVLVLHDFTDRKERQQRLQAEKEFLAGVVHSCPAGLAAYDAEGRISLWNPVLEGATGRMGSEVVGTALGEALASIAAPFAGSPAAQAVTGQTLMREEPLGKEGERWLHRLAPLRDATDAIVGGVLMAVPEVAGKAAATPRQMDLLAPVPAAPLMAPPRPIKVEKEAAPIKKPSPAPRPANPDDPDWLSFN